MLRGTECRKIAGCNVGHAITGHLHCRACGYDLHGLSPDDRCPECGNAVDQSIRGDQLRYGDPKWVRLLADGVSWIIVSVLLGTFPWLIRLLLDSGVTLFNPLLLSIGFGVVLVIVGAVIGATRTGSSRQLGLLLAVVGLAVVVCWGVIGAIPIRSTGLLAIEFGLVLAILGILIRAAQVGSSRRFGLVLLIMGLSVAVVGLAGLQDGLESVFRQSWWGWRIGIPLITVVGCWKLTSPDPDAAAAERRLSARVIARYTMVAWLLLVATEISFDIPWRILRIRWLPLGVTEVTLLAGGYIALCTYGRKLALRVPNHALARQTRIVMWGLVSPPILGVLLTAVLPQGLGGAYLLAYSWIFVLLPLMGIFTIWALVLLFVYRKAFRQAAQAGGT